MDRLGHIPTEFWVKFGLGVALLVVVVFLLRKLAHVNKVVLTVITGLVVSVVGFSWIYERNEPHWATPAVSFLADFFPTKGKVERR
jgi:apolipoprotein N-acyltransferase